MPESSDKRTHSHTHRSSKRRRKSRLKKQLRILSLFFLIIGLLVLFAKIYFPEDNVYNISNQKNLDTDYTLVENNDSLTYMAIIIYNKNIDINTISNTFYKSDLFWPYIYIENKNVIVNPLNIEKDVVLKIPHLSDSVLNLNDTKNLKKIKLLADSILENVTSPI